MKVTRHSVFETNSSSTHSISIDDTGVLDDLLPVNEDGICYVLADEYGWEVEDYNDAATKASYCLVYAKTSGNDTCDCLINMLTEAIKEVTGAKEVRYIPKDGEDDYYKWGYIDHQSHIGDGDACGEAFESKENLKQFIFNRRSSLHTDNDNH